MARLTSLLVATGGIAAMLLGGCNAVLGIDEAHSREGAGSSDTYLEIPIQACDGPKVGSDCGVCAQTQCETSFTACMADHNCRKAINTYRGCLGSRCNGSKCFDALKAGPASALAECMAGECKTCLGMSPWVSMCEVYCSCMASACETDLMADGALPWMVGSRADCLADCQGLDDLPSTHCRWTHCELRAVGEGSQHCTHAVSPKNCPTSVEVAQQCTTKNLNGWGCDRPADCCSNNCGGDRICAP